MFIYYFIQQKVAKVSLIIVFIVLGEHLGIISNAAVSSTNFRQPSQSLMMG